MRAVTWGRPLYGSHRRPPRRRTSASQASALRTDTAAPLSPPTPAGSFRRAWLRAPARRLTALTSAMRRPRGARVPAAASQGNESLQESFQEKLTTSQDLGFLIVQTAIRGCDRDPRHGGIYDHQLQKIPPGLQRAHGGTSPQRTLA